MYYHLTSNHLIKGMLFRDAEDKRCFINRMAVLAIDMNVIIYAYCIMDNHIHLLVSGSEEDILAFFSAIKKEYAQYASLKYGKDFSLEMFTPDIKEINSQEYFRAAVAYILRNPFAAGIASPYNYEWNSAWIYYQQSEWEKHEVSIKQYGLVKLRAMLHTRKALPENLLMCGDIISPRLWCGYKKVETIFGTSVDLFKAISKWTTEKDMESYLCGKEINSYSDSYLLDKVTAYCSQLGAALPSGLDPVSFRKLISLLSRKYGSSREQIVRLTGADEETIIRFA